MDDLISRQAAIEALLHNQEVYSNNFGDDPIDKYTIAIIDNDAQTIAQLPSVQPEPKWIPCSERLPEPVAPSKRREWFITSNTYGGVNVTCYEFEASPFKEGWQTDMTVLAWMPLPEPYKEEQE